MTGLSEHAASIAAKVIEEESAKREHVVIYLSGAHAYGFPSPDSDLDIKCIHCAPTASLLGLREPTLTFDRQEILEGVEIDYTSNELGPALAGVVRGNGNFVERFLGSMTLQTSPLLEELRPAVERALSRRLHRHYRGFAQSQVHELDRKSSVKKLLYVFRTCLTGVHVLSTGRIVTDLRVLLDAHGPPDVHSLIERKLAGERVALEEDERDRWTIEIQRIFDRLDQAHESSILPADPDERALDELLVSIRLRRASVPER